jgi:hypothetical protein
MAAKALGHEDESEPIAIMRRVSGVGWRLADWVAIQLTRLSRTPFH